MTFYGPLNRRAKYEEKADGSYYVYSHYRVAVAEDCGYRCVYCDCYGDDIGGLDAMETDHFRPWNKGFGVAGERLFAHLKNEPQNLVHSCGPCNRFKHDLWPTEDPDRPYDHEKGWIEPFEECRADFLQVADDGVLNHRKPPGAYQIKQLRLNRPLLKRLREYRILRERLAALLRTYELKWQATIDKHPETPQAQLAVEAMQVLAGFARLLNAPPPKLAD
jgi:5-methylcytosine-specific restriction endonuclease McrA